MYCERRRLYGRNEPGQVNLRRLDEMAHIRRREPWIDAAELLTDDRACFRRTGDRMLLSYAESWLMVLPPVDGPGPAAAVPRLSRGDPCPQGFVAATRRCQSPFRRPGRAGPGIAPGGHSLAKRSVTIAWPPHRRKRRGHDTRGVDDRTHTDRRRARRAAPPRLSRFPDQGIPGSGPDHLGFVRHDRRRRRFTAGHIERQGRYKAAMRQARAIVKGKPHEALPWAQRACELDPAQSEAWVLAIDLLWAMERDDEAVALCADAAARFPQLRVKAGDPPIPSGTACGRRGERRPNGLAREQEVSRLMAAARKALDDRRDDRAVEFCRDVLELEPGRIETLSMAASALQSAGTDR